jgi:hypothetical protein
MPSLYFLPHVNETNSFIAQLSDVVDTLSHAFLLCVRCMLSTSLVKPQRFNLFSSTQQA